MGKRSKRAGSILHARITHARTGGALYRARAHAIRARWIMDRVRDLVLEERIARTFPKLTIADTDGLVDTDTEDRG